LKVGLEVMPITSVTLSDGHGPGERAPSRRYGRKPLSSFRLWVPPRTGRSVLSGLADAAAALARMMSGAGRFGMVLNVS
jgi:hypothetical protein